MTDDNRMALEWFLHEWDRYPDDRPDAYLAMAAGHVADELKAAAERLRDRKRQPHHDPYDLLADVAAWRDAVEALDEANIAALAAVGRMEEAVVRSHRQEQEAGVSHG